MNIPSSRIAIQTMKWQKDYSGGGSWMKRTKDRHFCPELVEQSQISIRSQT
ncbi:hypothetical protein O3M35_012656 [Rhynocoris fuscipes]|uniref:Uncharacterized protein n=1 Tax=Rhynocoris fuscipes TaxID=488301 RepID=A0AAW1D131_9HEMI